MRIAILTSSRADFGIYRPLLKALKSDPEFDLKIIAFGTHFSAPFGNTYKEILESGFKIDYRVDSLLMGDSESCVSNSIGITISGFSYLWESLKGNIDMVFALGDRYEMFAAVAAAVPFNIPVAHIHGGETTTGAIDNVFRHSITSMSSLHFTSTEAYAERVRSITGNPGNIHYVGALGLDNLQEMFLLSTDQFMEKYGIDMKNPTILNTLHPETTSPNEIKNHAEILASVFEELSSQYQIVITMPNADTLGSTIRDRFNSLISTHNNIFGVESLGTLGYFSCIKHSSMLIGNTSSGIIEAASLKKHVINLGKRQENRVTSQNLFNASFNKEEILQLVQKIAAKGDYTGHNIYQKSLKSSREIVTILKNYAVKKLK